MGPKEVVGGATNVSVVIRIIDDTDGTPETGVTSATAGLALEYRREGATSTAITESDLSALTDAHSDGGMLHIGNGNYRVDIPDAAFATGVDGVLIHGTATGMIVLGPYLKLLDPVADLVATQTLGATGNSTTSLHLPDFGTYADDELIDELLYVYDVSEAEWHPAWITDWANTGDLATVISARGGAALPFTPEASVDLVARMGVTRSNILNTASLNAINAEADTAISDAALATAANLGTPSDLGGGATIADNLSDMAGATFATATDSQEAIRNHIGDGTNLTEAGGTGDHLTAINLPNQTMDITGDITGNLSGSVGSVTGAVGSVTGAVGSVSGNVDGNVTGSVGSLVGHTVQTGDSFARLGAPAGASVSADIAAIPTQNALPPTNTALSNIKFLMVLASDDVTPATGLTVTGQRTIDGGAESAVSGTIAEIGNGWYQFDALAADMNGGIIGFRFSSATANDTFLSIMTDAAW